MKYFSANNYIWLLLGILSFGSCKNPTYQLFYAEKGNMYFVTPLKFKGQDHTLLADFTFRDNPSSKQGVTCNVSLFRHDPVKISSIQMVNTTDSFELVNLERIFIEKTGKHFEIRYGGNLPLKVFHSFIQSGNFSIRVNKDETFQPMGKTSKKMVEVRDDVLQVIFLDH